MTIHYLPRLFVGINKTLSSLQGIQRFCSAAAAPTQCRDGQTVSRPASNKEALSVLRKATGYSFANCKKAVDRFGLDRMTEAEAWLHELAKEQGWAKAGKLKDRKAGQGLIGAAGLAGLGVLVELNCETDFVASSEAFRRLAALSIAATAQVGRRHPVMPGRVEITPDELLAENIGSARLGDEIVATLGQLGENIKLSRAVCLMGLETDCIVTYLHPRTTFSEANLVQQLVSGVSSVQVGRVGALLCLGRSSPDNSSSETTNQQGTSSVSLCSIGERLCQHVVGMAPHSVGIPLSPPEVETWKERQAAFEKAMTFRDEARHRTLNAVEGEEPKTEPDPEWVSEAESQWDDAEKRFLSQPFLSLQSVPVSEYCSTQGVTVHDFIRYQVGGGN